MTQEDYMLRGTALDGTLRVFAVTDRKAVDEARLIHGTYPTATAALGRLMSASLMMGLDMKNPGDLMTLRIDCDGPIGGMLVTADAKGHVKGYVKYPKVDLSLKANGKLDVSGAVGHGTLSVVRDAGLKEPYVGETELISGEIAEDISYYYAVSEQIPSIVSLGVLVDTDGSVLESGGFLVQLMPGADDSVIDTLEERLKSFPSVTGMLGAGLGPEDMLQKLLDGMELSIGTQLNCSYHCGCTRERVEKVLLSIGQNDLREIVDAGEDTELICHFCGKKYIFTPEEISGAMSRQHE